jgi:hypothetical protein
MAIMLQKPRLVTGRDITEANPLLSFKQAE